MSDSTPAREQEKIWVRLPDGMRERIAAAAKDNSRSANAEVVARLEASFAEPELDPNFAQSIREHAQKAMAIMVERIEREPLPRPDREARPVEETLSDAERRDLQILRDTFGAENVKVVEERNLAAQVFDPTTGSANLLVLAHSHAANQQRLDGDLYIVRRALGRDDVEIPIVDGRVQLDALPVEPMTRMMLATLLGYVDLNGRPTPSQPQRTLLERLDSFGVGDPPAAREKGPSPRLGPVKRKLGA